MDSKEKTIDNSLESTMNMTQDEIEWLLNQQSGGGEETKPEAMDADLMSLLAELEATNDEDIRDISALLTKDDKNEAVDGNIAALLKAQEEPGETAYDAMDLFSGEEVKKEKKGLFGKLFQKEKIEDKEKKPKKKKEKPQKEKPVKKGKGKQKDSIEQLDLESIELPEEHSADNNHDTMDDALALLQGIPSVEPREKGAVKKETEEKQKPKKKKEKKKEKSKKKTGKSENKEEKDKKVRIKEKATIEDAIMDLEAEGEEPPHKKKVVMVFWASILILFGFLVVNYYFTGHANKRLAQEAFEKKDYLECYQLLYGQSLNDSQAVMYHRSELILKDDIFRRDYEEHVKQEQWLEGLDKLVQYVYKYPELEEYAAKWNCSDIVEGTYMRVQDILEEDYETDIEKVSEIAGLVKDEDYTRALLKIVEEKQKRDAIYQKYPDILPEEEDRLFQ